MGGRRRRRAAQTPLHTRRARGEGSRRRVLGLALHFVRDAAPAGDGRVAARSERPTVRSDAAVPSQTLDERDTPERDDARARPHPRWADVAGWWFAPAGGAKAFPLTRPRPIIDRKSVV